MEAGGRESAMCLLRERARVDSCKLLTRRLFPWQQGQWEIAGSESFVLTVFLATGIKALLLIFIRFDFSHPFSHVLSPRRAWDSWLWKSGNVGHRDPSPFAFYGGGHLVPTMNTPWRRAGGLRM